MFTGEDTAMANLLLSIVGAFTEFEGALIGERQREGITLAKQRNAHRGVEMHRRLNEHAAAH
jgi:DNA invertase Pin-like site-specific DNA recombinase